MLGGRTLRSWYVACVPVRVTFANFGWLMLFVLDLGVDQIRRRTVTAC